MELLLWPLVPVGYALGVLLAEALWRFTDRPQRPVAQPVSPPDPERQLTVLCVVDGEPVHAWG